MSNYIIPKIGDQRWHAVCEFFKWSDWSPLPYAMSCQTSVQITWIKKKRGQGMNRNALKWTAYHITRLPDHHNIPLYQHSRQCRNAIPKLVFQYQLSRHERFLLVSTVILLIATEQHNSNWSHRWTKTTSRLFIGIKLEITEVHKLMQNDDTDQMMVSYYDATRESLNNCTTSTNYQKSSPFEHLRASELKSNFKQRNTATMFAAANRVAYPKAKIPNLFSFSEHTNFATDSLLAFIENSWIFRREHCSFKMAATIAWKEISINFLCVFH